MDDSVVDDGILRTGSDTPGRCDSGGRGTLGNCLATARVRAVCGGISSLGISARAGRRFRCILGPGDMPEDERAKVMSDLEQYCGRDTEGMIWIVDKLRGIVNG